MGGSNTFLSELERRGVSRRQFVKFCSMTAAALSLPGHAAGAIAKALAAPQKPVLVWLEFQDCAGNSESLLRASRPTVAEIVLDVLSIDYHETIMAAAGHQADELRDKVVNEKKGTYLVVVEGSVPMKDGGVYCTIGGRSAVDIVRQLCGNAAATIAIGTCAAFGGLPAASPNPTGAVGVADAVPGIKNLINLPACPANVENLTALVVHYLTFKEWPALDQYNRPLFAYGKTIHNNCERRAHFDASQYVEMWGDEGHRSGYCLYKMGCKGPVTYQNCPTVRWNEGTNWPIGCGHPCIGCAEADFWDKMSPFYQHLEPIPGFNIHANIDKIGLAATGLVAATFAAHGVVAAVKHRQQQKKLDEPAPSERKGEQS